MCQTKLEFLQTLVSIVNFDSIQNQNTVNTKAFDFEAFSKIAGQIIKEQKAIEAADIKSLQLKDKDILIKDIVFEDAYASKFSTKGVPLKDVKEKHIVKDLKEIKNLDLTLNVIEKGGLTFGLIIAGWIVYLVSAGYKVLLDAAINYQVGFQDPASPIMEEIINFHNYVMLYITFIIIAVLWVLADVIYTFNGTRKAISHKYLIHGTWLEIIWTLMPAVVLIFIAFPSFKLIYLIDEVIDAGITIKAIGHQWYWSYEYSDYYTQDGKTIEFDSYMIPTDDLQIGQLRLLEVDNNVVVPTNTNVRVIITATDVLHCWAVPSLGIKLDAVPGRLNQVAFLANREGLFYGQCSEICGANHAFMPIVVEAVKLDKYCNFITNSLK